ncbi:tetrapyrrole methylase [Paraphysoderma sedebokerense]|nr:tetrapyrrole methylase [Paraphysoderma sedebokerense]
MCRPTLRSVFPNHIHNSQRRDSQTHPSPLLVASAVLKQFCIPAVCPSRVPPQKSTIHTMFDLSVPPSPPLSPHSAISSLCPASNNANVTISFKTFPFQFLCVAIGDTIEQPTLQAIDSLISINAPVRLLHIKRRTSRRHSLTPSISSLHESISYSQTSLAEFQALLSSDIHKNFWNSIRFVYVDGQIDETTEVLLLQWKRRSGIPVSLSWDPESSDFQFQPEKRSHPHGSDDLIISDSALEEDIHPSEQPWINRDSTPETASIYSDVSDISMTQVDSSPSITGSDNTSSSVPQSDIISSYQPDPNTFASPTTSFAFQMEEYMIRQILEQHYPEHAADVKDIPSDKLNTLVEKVHSENARNRVIKGLDELDNWMQSLPPVQKDFNPLAFENSDPSISVERDLNDSPGESPHIYLIGAGPGCIPLLTLSTYHLLATSATVPTLILSDRLIPPSIRLLIPPSPTTKIYNAQKLRGKCHSAQAALNSMMVAAFKSGKISRIIRLKGGDPFLFGRGGEEYLYALENGIRKENISVLPGLSSSLTGPLGALIPVTHRGTANQVFISTGRTQSALPASRPIPPSASSVASLSLSSSADIPSFPLFSPSTTLVLLMCVERLDTLIEELTTKYNYPPSLPVAIIEKAMWRGEMKVAKGTLIDIFNVCNALDSSIADYALEHFGN